MSTLLNEAILDAKLIKEAAKKAAYNSLKEKYSDEYRKNFKSELFKKINEAPKLPGQDDELDPDKSMQGDELGQDFQTDAENNTSPDGLSMGGGDELGLGSDEGGQETPEDKEITDKIPHAFKDEKDTCQCPEEDEEITIDLGDLSKTLNDDVADALDMGAPTVDRNTLAGKDEVPMGEENKEDEDLFTLNKESLERFLDLEDEMKEKINELSLRNKFLNEKLNEMNKVNENLSDRLSKTNNELKKSTSMNLRLVYQNKVLSDASLNERQKKSMVESINKIKNSEAEMLPSVYQMLREAIGGVATASKPGYESLVEIANKKANNFFVKPKEEQEVINENGFKKRWKELARLK